MPDGVCYSTQSANTGNAMLPQCMYTHTLTDHTHTCTHTHTHTHLTQCTLHVTYHWPRGRVAQEATV